MRLEHKSRAGMTYSPSRPPSRFASLPWPAGAVCDCRGCPWSL